MRLNRFFAGCMLLLSIGASLPARAHDVPQSVMFLDIGRQTIDVELHMPLSELGLALQLPLAAAPDAVIPQYGSRIDQYVQDGFQLRSRDGRTYDLSIDSLDLQRTDNINWTSNDWLVVHARLAAPEGASTEVFGIDDKLIVQRVLSHETLVYVRRDIRNGLAGDKPMPIGLMGFGKTHLDVDGSNGSWWQGFCQLLKLGMRHIAEGADHQLFLLALLLPAPLMATAGRWRTPAASCKSLRNLLGIVSGFTLGHSTTLALAAAGWIVAPTRAVEVLIAVSILVSSIHAWRPLFAGREIWIASGFGLVHGLAFAEVLSGLNFDGWSLTLSLLGFNLGIEGMQLAVVGMVFPWLLLMRTSPLYQYVRMGGAIFAGTLAVAWVLERALNFANPLNQAVETLSAHPLLVVSVLAGVAVLSRFREMRCKTLFRYFISVAFMPSKAW